MQERYYKTNQLILWTTLFFCPSNMSDLCKSDGAGVGEDPDVDQHIGQQGQHQAPHEPAHSF